MNYTENKDIHRSLEGFENIKNKLAGPHLQVCSEKIAGLKPEQTAELCHKNDEIIAKHMAKNGIDFFAALNSLKSRI